MRKPFEMTTLQDLGNTSKSSLTTTFKFLEQKLTHVSEKKANVISSNILNIFYWAKDLLEKSRVTIQPVGERNFHIFYQLCAKGNTLEREMFELKDPQNFKYLRSCTDIGLDEDREFEDTRNAMALFGINEEAQYFIFTLLASILHIGDLNFDKGKNDAVVIQNPEGSEKKFVYTFF